MSSTKCECGALKSPNHFACDRCRFLDGKSVGEGLVIGALQDAGGYVTSGDVAQMIGKSQRQVLRHLRKLVKKSRVVRVEYDGGDPVLYCLTDRRAA